MSRSTTASLLTILAVGVFLLIVVNIGSSSKKQRYLVVERTSQGVPFQCWRTDDRPVSYDDGIVMFRNIQKQLIHTKANIFFLEYEKGDFKKTKKQLKLTLKCFGEKT